MIGAVVGDVNACGAISLMVSWSNETGLFMQPRVKVETGNNDFNCLFFFFVQILSTLIDVELAVSNIERDESKQKVKTQKETLPRGIEPRSPALIGVNDKRKS